MPPLAEHRAPQHESRVTGLDVFASAVRLDVEERAKAVRERRPAPLLALDGFAGLVAAYIALHHEHGLDLPSAFLLTDTLWPSDVALVTLCRDEADAPPPLTHALVQNNPDRVLPRYGLEEVPTAEEQSVRALFTFRLLAATQLREFVTRHAIAEGYLKAPGHPRHLVRVSTAFRKSMDAGHVDKLDYSAVRPSAIAVWALEVLCALERVTATSYGACMLVRLVYVFECESRASSLKLKEVWLKKRDWLECLSIIKANGELKVLEDGVAKLSDQALLDALAQWEVEIHGGDERSVRASYSRAMTLYGTLVKDTVAHLSKPRSATAYHPLPRGERRVRLHRSTTLPATAEELEPAAVARASTSSPTASRSEHRDVPAWKRAFQRPRRDNTD